MTAGSPSENAGESQVVREGEAKSGSRKCPLGQRMSYILLLQKEITAFSCEENEI